jgi:hypothetical protein
MPVKRIDFREWRPHPWHGLEAGRELPVCVNAYIEITPFHLELDQLARQMRERLENAI